MSKPPKIPPPDESTGYFLRATAGPVVEQVFTAPATGRGNAPAVSLRCMQLLWTEPSGALRVTELWLPTSGPAAELVATAAPGQLLTVPVTVAVDPKTNTLRTALRRDPHAALRIINASTR